MLCVEFILVRATVGWCNGTVLCVKFIILTATVDIVQWCPGVCGFYCCYSRCSYSAMVILCVCSLFWLEQQ